MKKPRKTQVLPRYRGQEWVQATLPRRCELWAPGNPRSMASGVSMATIPTMAGMVAALSGVAMATYLQRKAARERELLSDHLVIGNE